MPSSTPPDAGAAGANSARDDDDDDESPAPVVTPRRSETRPGRMRSVVRPFWAPGADGEVPPPPVSPAPSRLALGSWLIGLGFDVMWRADPSYDYLFERGVTPALAIVAGREITRPASRWVLGVDVGWRYAATNGRVASSLQTEQTSHAFSGGVFGRWAAAPFFAPYVRLGGGGGVAQTRVASDLDAPLSGTSAFAFGTLGAGIYLRSTGVLVERGAASNLGFALAVEGGFQLATAMPVELTLEPPPNREAALERIAVRPVQMGAVSATGPYLHVRVDVRF